VLLLPLVLQLHRRTWLLSHA